MVIFFISVALSNFYNFEILYIFHITKLPDHWAVIWKSIWQLFIIPIHAIMLISTVEQQIFACRKFSRISQISRDSRNFPAREYYYFTAGVLSFHHDFTEWKSDIYRLSNSPSKLTLSGLISEVGSSCDYTGRSHVWVVVNTLSSSYDLKGSSPLGKLSHIHHRGCKQSALDHIYCVHVLHS